MFAAISGLRVHQTMLDVTANNISNVNTIGYKAERVSFKEALSQTVRGGGAAVAGGLGGTSPAQIGLGVQLGSIDKVVSPGAIQTTGGKFDVAVQGEGWFQVSTDPTSATAPKYYTRSGNFTLDGNGALVTGEGYYVVGMTGGPPPAASKITVPATATSVSVDAGGVVTVVDGGTTTAYTIQLAKFSNEAGLQRVSGNRFEASPNAGTIAVGNPGTAAFGSVQPGTVEMSNVDLAQEFTAMITAQRGFQANSRVISSADDMLQELVNLNR
jgi:flagellar hook protein FlgE